MTTKTVPVEPTEVVRTAPPRIWLQVSEDADHCNEPFPPIPNEDLTWCHESVLDCEVEYVRADLAAAPAIEREVLAQPPTFLQERAQLEQEWVGLQALKRAEQPSAQGEPTVYLDEFHRQAATDAAADAQGEPVSEVTDFRNASLYEDNRSLLPIGTKLYTHAPDSAAEIARLTKFQEKVFSSGAYNVAVFNTRIESEATIKQQAETIDTFCKVLKCESLLDYQQQAEKLQAIQETLCAYKEKKFNANGLFNNLLKIVSSAPSIEGDRRASYWCQMATDLDVKNTAQAERIKELEKQVADWKLVIPLIETQKISLALMHQQAQSTAKELKAANAVIELIAVEIKDVDDVHPCRETKRILAAIEAHKKGEK